MRDALRALLDGSTDGERRLQDPLSFRCVSQTHGSLAARSTSSRRLEPELNGAGTTRWSCSRREIVSTGNFFGGAHARCDTVALALAQVAKLASARIARCSRRRSPIFRRTSRARLDRNGDGAAPEGDRRARRESPTGPAVRSTPGGAEAVEDASTGAPLAAQLSGLLERLRLLCAAELLVAAGRRSRRDESLGRGTATAYDACAASPRPGGRSSPRPDVERVRRELGRLLAG